jgi:hypothetical protein
MPRRVEVLEDRVPLPEGRPERTQELRLLGVVQVKDYGYEVAIAVYWIRREDD